MSACGRICVIDGRHRVVVWEGIWVDVSACTNLQCVQHEHRDGVRMRVRCAPEVDAETDVWVVVTTVLRRYGNANLTAKDEEVLAVGFRACFKLVC